MTPSPITVDADADLLDAIRLMVDNAIGGVPVLEGERLVGIITATDVMRLCLERWSKESES